MPPPPPPVLPTLGQVHTGLRAIDGIRQSIDGVPMEYTMEVVQYNPDNNGEEAPGPTSSRPQQTNARVGAASPPHASSSVTVTPAGLLSWA